MRVASKPSGIVQSGMGRRFTGGCGGETLRAREVAGLKLAEVAYRSRLNLQQHAHEHALFCLVLRGAHEERYGSRRHLCKPNTLTFKPAGETHSNQMQQSGARCFSIEMDSQWLKRVPPESEFLQSPARFSGGSPTWLATRLHREFQQPPDQMGPLAMEGLALELLAEVSRHRAPLGANGEPGWLETAREFLQEQFMQPLTLAQVAAPAGVHPVSLARAFRRAYHCTVADYVRKLRVDFACRRLAGADVPLAEIALSAGFSDQAHFCRTFKRLTGLTPSQCRALSRRS